MLSGHRAGGESQASIVLKIRDVITDGKTLFELEFGSDKRAFKCKKVIVSKDSEERQLSTQRISRNLV